VNARISAATVTPIHPERIAKLQRDLDPWDIPIRALAPEPFIELQDVQSEDFVLAYMLSNPGRVASLSPQDFTGRDRPVIYATLRDQHPDSVLDLLDERLDHPGYINELRWQPSLRAGSLKECIANLKRLSSLRDLAETVDAWRRRMPTMTAQAAKSELARICFGRRA
jgi:hypothetical protein